MTIDFEKSRKSLINYSMKHGRVRSYLSQMYTDGNPLREVLTRITLFFIDETHRQTSQRISKLTHKCAYFKAKDDYIYFKLRE